ncbi:MAG TPA: sigma-54 dependent transcriptional regulator [Byssovorax sp.]|jgi:two-component system response regulator AtoC
MGKVLVVDDEPAVLFTLKEVLVDGGHDVVTASSGRDALGRLDGVEAVVTDLSMPGMDGLELLAAIRAHDASLPIVLLTAHGSERVAVQAMKAGAYDYATKPFDIDELRLVVARALEARSLRDARRMRAVEQAVGKRVIASSAAMRRLLEAVARVADKDVTVLVRGETGTGKELVGSMLHAESRRADKPLVRFNCAAIPGELAEAELFGHQKGAFTGATSARRGFFAEAHTGTLVLDEVGELALPVQAKLLRAIQEGEIQPVGSGRVERVDVRVVACTNRDLAAEAHAGRFREDLYYRLAVIELVVPRLRDRADDIPALAEEFARRYGDRFGLPNVRLAPALVERLKAEPWPGNVRELENTIARLVAMAEAPLIDASAWAPSGEPPAAASAREVDGEPPPAPIDGLSLREQVEAFERSLVARALAAAHGNQSEAARRLGTSRPTLIDKIKKYRLGDA